jgi:hypothetical protein
MDLEKKRNYYDSKSDSSSIASDVSHKIDDWKSYLKKSHTLKDIKERSGLKR